MKIPTSLILAILLLFTPQSHRAQSKPDEKLLAPAFCALVVVGVGVVIVIGLKKLCEKIPPVDGPPPTPPYHPPTMHDVQTNLPPWFKRISPPLADQLIPVRDISAFQIPDTYGDGKALTYFKALVALKLQSTTNLNDWRDEMTVTQWISDRGSFSAVYQGGSNVMNCYSVGITNYIPIEIGGSDKKFFRAVMP